MSSKKLPIARRRGLWPALGLVLTAVAVAGCGGAVRVQPTTPAGSATLASRGNIDSPLTDIHNHLGCLHADDLPVQVLSPTKLQIGAAPAGPTVVFTPTAGRRRPRRSTETRRAPR